LDSKAGRFRCSISELSELLGVTHRAIRYYEQRGLIRPARDRLNTRIYDADTRARLNLIVQLRAAGVGLRDIQAILALGDTAGVAAQWRAIRQALTREIRRLEARRDRAARILQEHENTEIASGPPSRAARHV